MEIKELIKALGQQHIAEAVGVAEETVRLRQYKDKLPARWYIPLSKLALEKGAECPRDMFDQAGSK